MIVVYIGRLEVLWAHFGESNNSIRTGTASNYAKMKAVDENIEIVERKDIIFHMCNICSFDDQA